MRAGSYSSPVYSGGSAVVTYASPYYRSSNNYAFDSNNAWGGYGSGVTFTGPEGGSTNLSETAMGTITTTFTWQPSYAGEPAPASAIVAQHCTAGWVGHLSGTGMPTGRCDNGLGGSLVLYYEAGTCDSTKYTVKAANADGSVTVLCSPSVHLDCESGTNGTAGGSVTVSYSATVYPVTISLTGQNSANQALTGQQITASLLIPNGLPSGTKITNYTWSFDGATAPNPIKTWDGTASGDSTHPQLVPLTAADMTGADTSGNGISVSSVSFYDQVADNVTVKCAVSLKFSDGTTATVNAKSVPVAFLKPSLTKWDIKGGWVQHYNSTTWGLAIDPLSSIADGMTWSNATISVPTPFSGGQGCFVQTVTPDRRIYQANVTTPITGPNNGQAGLDGSFPYGPLWNLPSLGADKDGPAVVSGANANGYQGYDKITVNDTYTTWVMYKPPSNGIGNPIWVPLKSYGWGFSCTIQWQTNAWVTTQAPPSNAATVPVFSPASTNTPPKWSLVQSNY